MTGSPEGRGGSGAQTVAITIGGVGRVSGAFIRPDDAWVAYVLAHGAGAGMHHPFLEAVTAQMTARGIATLRYQFPYMEAGRKRPDTPRVATATVRAAVEVASRLAPELPVIAGGKSFGGRMTSMAAADDGLPSVRGLVFLGFPLHRPGAPGRERADHLHQVPVPMLFLQGDRDALADPAMIAGVCEQLGTRATLHVVAGGDHSFTVLKRSGRTERDVLNELGQSIAGWSASVARR